MPAHRSGGRRRRSVPTDVAGAAVLCLDLREHPLDIWFDKVPCSHVFRLFLAPHHVGLGEPSKFGDERPRRERIELLDAHQVDVVDAALLALLIEVVIDLAGAQHDALDLRIGDDLAFVPEELAPPIVRFCPSGMDAQGFVEPGQRFVDAPVVRGLHRLVQAVPVAVLVLHLRGGRGGEPNPRKLLGWGRAE